jgi:hypothetical protein
MHSVVATTNGTRRATVTAAIGTAMTRRPSRPPREPCRFKVPQVRGAESPYRCRLMGFLVGNCDVLERLVVEMYAQGLSTRDVEDCFRDATGELLISKSAVS